MFSKRNSNPSPGHLIPKNVHTSWNWLNRENYWALSLNIITAVLVLFDQLAQLDNCWSLSHGNLIRCHERRSKPFCCLLTYIFIPRVVWIGEVRQRWVGAQWSNWVANTTFAAQAPALFKDIADDGFRLMKQSNWARMATVGRVVMRPRAECGRTGPAPFVRNRSRKVGWLFRFETITCMITETILI